jgi:putative tryptophan/tyrosine transport system substrate-binding protein
LYKYAETLLKGETPMKKRILAILLAALMLFALTSCGSTATDSNTTTADADANTDSSADNTEDESSGSDAASGKTYTIGICQLVQHEALDSATQGFRDALTDLLGDSVKFDEQNASNDSANCAVIVNGFVSSNYDLIMANATPALQAAVTATNKIPILGTSVTDYATALDISDWTGVTGMNVSGTSDLAPLDGQADMVKELFPDAKTVGILYCSGEANSAYQVKTITPLLEDLGYTVTAYSFADSNDVTTVTTTACSENDVLYIPTDNTAASCTEAINNVALNAGVPIIAGEEGIAAGCAVATLSISYYDLGYATGEMAYEILVNGADVSTMEIQFAPQFTKKYNADICAKLNITVPDDYVAIG